MCATVASAAVESGPPDPVFSTIPFEQWRFGGKQPLVHWSVDIVTPELSGFQRIVTGVKIQIDEHDLPYKRALLLVEFEDAEGGVWQTHSTLGTQTESVQNAFVLPGDYSVSVAIYDPATLKHSFTQKKLHVAPLRVDPLRGSWGELPRVEFLPPDADLADSWFLPSIVGRLSLPVQTRRPVHLVVLLNTTPAENNSEPIAELRRNMSVLMPALKVVSQLELRDGSMDVALLDLTRRHVSFEQRNVQTLDWNGMKEFLTRENPGIIDVHALDGRWKMRNFFLNQLTERIRAQNEPAQVVIVLSGPAFFRDQEPAAQLALPIDPARRVFYIRCRDIPRSVLAPRPRPRPGARPRPVRPAIFQLPLDDLERPLNSPDAMLFDVITPEQFRRVLAVVIREISGL